MTLSERDGPAGRGLVRRGIKFSQLRLLVALRETGQVSAAAQAVGTTQPAASRLLAQLEKIVGTPLYDRHSRGVVLTGPGRLLADQADEVLHGLDRAGQRIAQAVSGARGTVRIGSVTGPALELLLPVIRKARLAYPDIDLSIEVDTSDKLAERLLATELDFYLGRIPDGAETGSFALSVVGPEPIALVVRRDHPLIRIDALDLGRCLSYLWVMQPVGGLLRRTTESYLLRHGHPLPEQVIGTTSQLFTLAIIHETNAIAPLARSVADFFIDRGGLDSRLDRLPVAEDMAVADYGLVTRADVTLTPAGDRLKALLADEIARFPATDVHDR